MYLELSSPLGPSLPLLWCHLTSHWRIPWAASCPMERGNLISKSFHLVHAEMQNTKPSPQWSLDLKATLNNSRSYFTQRPPPVCVDLDPLGLLFQLFNLLGMHCEDASPKYPKSRLPPKCPSQQWIFAYLRRNNKKETIANLQWLDTCSWKVFHYCHTPWPYQRLTYPFCPCWRGGTWLSLSRCGTWLQGTVPKSKAEISSLDQKHYPVHMNAGDRAGFLIYIISLISYLNMRFREVVQAFYNIYNQLHDATCLDMFA